MKIGCHVSIAKGIYNAPARAADFGCETFQIFVRSPRGRGKNISDQDVKYFKNEMEKYEFDRFYIHAPYYINLASTNKRIYYGSITALRKDLEDGSRLGATGMMTHLGSAKDIDPAKAISMVADGIRKILDGYRGSCKFLIEISAGSGTVIGDDFFEIGQIIKKIPSKNVGVCFDTQHAFASGYDLRTSAGISKVFQEFDEQIGLDRLVLSHVNDSKVDLGSRVDRHEDLGKGKLGRSMFEQFVKHKKIKNLDLILETPTGADQYKKEIILLKKFRDSR